MSRSEFRSFQEFWSHYLREHADARNRGLHITGTVASTVLLSTAVLHRKWRWLPLALVPGYAAAWIGHFVF